ncbi:hypothetical protein D3C75_1309800 [compost metagenome]
MGDAVFLPFRQHYLSDPFALLKKFIAVPLLLMLHSKDSGIVEDFGAIVLG